MNPENTTLGELSRRVAKENRLRRLAEEAEYNRQVRDLVNGVKEVMNKHPLPRDTRGPLRPRYFWSET